ncbi:DMT family transporter [Pseudohoeflea sp. DP4N28-3]|uniref:DMT family transporter n=2 Tax=Pseudohoeflea coraliihabitans TaxID=2860393 RepID=A0ABS6WJ25_9HYPH|nr:DMT family transporter [Pseudohoeflea sp. DP4N28-3]MBW3095941.1 DMT family transporter [Pseudohoeflea sp. DP4N28-3]
MRSMNAFSWSLLVLLGLIWGASFYFARVAVPYVPPMTLVFLRVAIAALALHLVFGRTPGFYSQLRRRAFAFLVLGLLNNAIPFTLIFTGQTVIGAGLASILNATTPLWTVLIAQVLTSDEKISPNKLIGCALGLAGTAVLIGPAAFDLRAAPLWPMLCIIAAAISYGFAVIWAKRFRDMPPRSIATGQLTASSFLMLPLAAFWDQPWHLPAPPPGVLFAILALALVSTAFAYILYFRILARAGATNASLVTLLVPPSAILLGVLLLGESLSIGEFSGLLLIALGLLILDNRLVVRRRRKS